MPSISLKRTGRYLLLESRYKLNWLRPSSFTFKEGSQALVLRKIKEKKSHRDHPHQVNKDIDGGGSNQIGEVLLGLILIRPLNLDQDHGRFRPHYQCGHHLKGSYIYH